VETYDCVSHRRCEPRVAAPYATPLLTVLPDLVPEYVRAEGAVCYGVWKTARRD